MITKLRYFFLESKAEEAVLSYLNKNNRPYSAGESEIMYVYKIIFLNFVEIQNILS